MRKRKQVSFPPLIAFLLSRREGELITQKQAGKRRRLNWFWAATKVSSAFNERILYYRRLGLASPHSHTRLPPYLFRAEFILGRASGEYGCNCTRAFLRMEHALNPFAGV